VRIGGVVDGGHGGGKGGLEEGHAGREVTGVEGGFVEETLAGEGFWICGVSAVLITEMATPKTVERWELTFWVEL
jgi:hypothetical protein